MQQRRKSPFAAAPAAAKPEGEEAPARRPGAPLSLAGLLVCIFLVAIFLYNEDAVVKPPADAGAGDFPLAGASRASSQQQQRHQSSSGVGAGAAGVQPVPGVVDVRRGGLPGAAVPGAGVRVPYRAGDLHAQRPPRRLVSAVALAALLLRPPQVRCAGAAGAAAEQEADVRGGLAEPEPVGVDGVPGVVGDPGARPKVAGQVRRAQRLAERVHGQGVQRDGGVLLGAVPGAVQLGRPAGAQRDGPGHRVAVHRQARPALARRPLARLQHLHLVAQQLRHQSAEEPEGFAGEVHAGGPAGGVQGGAQDVGQVGGPARGPQENQGLLHGHVAKPHRAGRVGRDPGRGQVRHGDAAYPQPHGAALHRHRLAASRRGGGRAALHAPGARPPRRHHRAVRVPQGRAHLRAHAAPGEAAHAGAAGRPARLRRLHPLVPPRPPRHLEPLPLRPDRRLAASAVPAVVVVFVLALRKLHKPPPIGAVVA